MHDLVGDLKETGTSLVRAKGRRTLAVKRRFAAVPHTWREDVALEVIRSHVEAANQRALLRLGAPTDDAYNEALLEEGAENIAEEEEEEDLLKEREDGSEAEEDDEEEEADASKVKCAWKIENVHKSLTFCSTTTMMSTWTRNGAHDPRTLQKRETVKASRTTQEVQRT